MPFNNDIAGGNGQLVRNWIQSDNFVTGSTGWRISKNGDAEFNNGTFRGSIEVGPLTGQHFIVNNTATGDVIDVYSAANQLVLQVDNTGRMRTYSSLSTAILSMVAASLVFGDTAQTPNLNPRIGSSISPTLVNMTITGGRPQNYVGAGQGAFIQLSTGTTTQSEVIAAEQKGVQGALIQNADSINDANITRSMMISVTTNAGGDGTANHNMPVKPVAITGTAAPTSFVQQGVTVIVWQDLITNTQFSFRILTSTGNPFTGTMNVMFTFWG